jgi:hypothetical protein
MPEKNSATSRSKRAKRAISCAFQAAMSSRPTAVTATRCPGTGPIIPTAIMTAHKAFLLPLGKVSSESGDVLRHAFLVTHAFTMARMSRFSKTTPPCSPLPLTATSTMAWARSSAGIT